MNTPERRKWARENGICCDCSRPAEPNRLRCKTCLKSDCRSTTKYLKNNTGYVAARDKRVRERNKKAGKCIRCGLKLGEQDAGFAKCQNCREELCI